MNRDKDYLKGHVVGHAADTLGYKGLLVQLENLDIVEIDKNLVHKEIDKSQPIKLKDVIARLKGFDVDTQKVWLDEILNELGSDYETLKYKAGYEQGKLDGAMECEKVTVPQFVADYIEFKKKYDFHVYGAMREIEDHYDKRVPEWFYENNIETFVRAWLDGYEVEKEPKYTLKVKATKQYLSNDEIGIHFDPSFRSNFTKSDLEKLGLGWVFDCEGMEVEKVGK